jgi:hypothetical protein
MRTPAQPAAGTATLRQWIALPQWLGQAKQVSRVLTNAATPCIARLCQRTPPNDASASVLRKKPGHNDAVVCSTFAKPMVDWSPVEPHRPHDALLSAGIIERIRPQGKLFLKEKVYDNLSGSQQNGEKRGPPNIGRQLARLCMAQSSTYGRAPPFHLSAGA